MPQLLAGEVLHTNATYSANTKFIIICMRIIVAKPNETSG